MHPRLIWQFGNVLLLFRTQPRDNIDESKPKNYTQGGRIPKEKINSKRCRVGEVGIIPRPARAKAPRSEKKFVLQSLILQLYRPFYSQVHQHQRASGPGKNSQGMCFPVSVIQMPHASCSILDTLRQMQLPSLPSKTM